MEMARTSQDSGYVDNWQTGKTVIEYNLHMLKTEDCSDVIFRVGSEKHVVQAHRYVLVSRSCVFKAMFCGPLAEKGEITIPDIEPHIFREFLRFVYTDTADITDANVMGLLYTSRKYAVDVLHSKCTAFVEHSLTEENVCQILEQYHGHGEEDLEKKALEVLANGGVKVTESQSFLDLCSDCLDTFLKSDDLKQKEESVFEASLSWAKHQCFKDGVPQNVENIRTFLGDMKYEIRFKSMSLDYITRIVGPSGVLSGSERVLIMDSLLQPNMDISPFNAKQRDFRLRKYVPRFRGIGQWIPTGAYSLFFSCDRNISLLGFQLYGPRDSMEDYYKIGCQLRTKKDGVISEPYRHKRVKLLGKRKVNDIDFPEAVPLVAAQLYTLCVTIDGPNMTSGTDAFRSQLIDGAKFTFPTSLMVECIVGLIFEG